jgi:hypothetical protein
MTQPIPIYVLVHHAEFGREPPMLMSAWPSLEAAQKAFETELSLLDGENEYEGWIWSETSEGVWVFNDRQDDFGAWDSIQRVELQP